MTSKSGSKKLTYKDIGKLDKVPCRVIHKNQQLSHSFMKKKKKEQAAFIKLNTCVMSICPIVVS